jgi:hypothetical protein
MPGWEQAPAAEAPASTDLWGATTATDNTDTNDNANGAGDAWGSHGATDNAAEAGPSTDTPQLSKEDLVERARGHGWANAVPFNYEAFQPQGGNNAEFHGSAQVYEWKGEYGDVGPKIPELETMLFGGEFQMRRGEHIAELTEKEAIVEGPKKLRVRKVSFVWCDMYRNNIY